MPGILDAILAFSFLGSAIKAVPASTPRSTTSQWSGSSLEGPTRRARVPREQLPISVQWQTLCAIIERASDSLMRALDAHGAARTHLEVAEFSLDRIFDEVGAVMDLHQDRNMALSRARIAGGATAFTAA